MTKTFSCEKTILGYELLTRQWNEIIMFTFFLLVSAKKTSNWRKQAQCEVWKNTLDAGTPMTIAAQSRKCSIQPTYIFPVELQIQQSQAYCMSKVD